MQPYVTVIKWCISCKQTASTHRWVGGDCACKHAKHTNSASTIWLGSFWRCKIHAIRLKIKIFMRMLWLLLYHYMSFSSTQAAYFHSCKPWHGCMDGSITDAQLTMADAFVYDAWTAQKGMTKQHSSCLMQWLARASHTRHKQAKAVQVVQRKNLKP